MKRIIVFAAAVLTLAAGCANTPAPRPALPRIPGCMTGAGADGSHSTLTITQHGAAFTGTYINVPAGAAAGLKYNVTGTLHGRRFTSSWDAGPLTVPVTGSVRPGGIVLDNPSGTLRTVEFTAAAACP